MQCSFQATSSNILKNHMNFKHTKIGDQEVHDCSVCKRQFRSIWNLKHHTRDEHGKDEECVFYKENKCKFWNTCWKADTGNIGNIKFLCYSCKETFKSMKELMSHRKREHIELCKPCEPKNGTCRFEDHPEKCWFLHKDFSQASKKQNPP